MGSTIGNRSFLSKDKTPLVVYFSRKVKLEIVDFYLLSLIIEYTPPSMIPHPF
jgi:hypothetical protein